MSVIEMFSKELEQEAVTTRKMLERVPEDKYDWQPHPKSMTVRQLTTHIAELPGWVALVLKTDGIDFAVTPYEPEKINNTDELLELHERSLVDGRASLSQATDDQLDPTWTLRNGDEIYSASPKNEMIRMTCSQIIHHRAQLGVYLRLLNIPIPGSYGPSADEQEF